LIPSCSDRWQRFGETWRALPYAFAGASARPVSQPPAKGEPPMKVRVHLSFNAGVLDPQGRAINHALEGLGFAGINNVRAGRLPKGESIQFRRMPLL
jgi:Phosphoribosylformylglycinamidine (FGAM) synthase